MPKTSKQPAASASEIESGMAQPVRKSPSIPNNGVKIFGRGLTGQASNSGTGGEKKTVKTPKKTTDSGKSNSDSEMLTPESYSEQPDTEMPLSDESSLSENEVPVAYESDETTAQPSKSSKKPPKAQAKSASKETKPKTTGKPSNTSIITTPTSYITVNGEWDEVNKLIADLPAIVDFINDGGVLNVAQVKAFANATNFADKVFSLTKMILAHHAHYHIDVNGVEHAEPIADMKERLPYEAIAPMFAREPGTIKSWIYTVQNMSPELRVLCDGTLLTPSHVKKLCAYDIPNESRVAIAERIRENNAAHMEDPETVEWFSEAVADEMAKTERDRISGKPAVAVAQDIVRFAVVKSPVVGPDRFAKTEYAFLLDGSVPLTYTDPKTGVTREVLSIQTISNVHLTLGDVVAQEPAKKKLPKISKRQRADETAAD